MFKTVLTPVHDVDTVRPVWTALLGEPTNDDSYYVGWSLDGQEIGLVALVADAEDNLLGLMQDPTVPSS